MQTGWPKSNRYNQSTAYLPYTRPIEVLSDRQTGETILDEALRLMKSQEDGPGGGVQGEKMSVGSWVDLMSGMWLEIVLYASH